MINSKPLLEELVDVSLVRFKDTLMSDKQILRIVDEAILGQGLTYDESNYKHKALRAQQYFYLNDLKEDIAQYSARLYISGVISFSGLSFGGFSGWIFDYMLVGAIGGVLTGLGHYIYNSHVFRNKKRKLIDIYSNRIDRILRGEEIPDAWIELPEQEIVPYRAEVIDAQVVEEPETALARRE